MDFPHCPQCDSSHISRNGIVKERQRYKCKDCGYNYTVDKLGKSIESYFVIKALQLYLEGISYREIERLLGISHVSVMNWVKKYRIVVPSRKKNYKPTTIILTYTELQEFYSNRENLKGIGIIITEFEDKFMLIKWERTRN
ncbi:transposase-like zinc-binding domain-containing protein [Emticicia sp. 17c]|uniref:transposase-like zinc-binding domain-containing protein n=1 Tax=Emticicia sp. 17c TaxID=3127704 RepID=UPI003FA5F954